MGLLNNFFRGTSYKCFVILCSSENKCAWNYQIWSEDVAPILENILKKCQEAPSVHSRQIYKNNSNKEVILSPLDWSLNGHANWCHNSDKTRDICQNWRFIDTIITTPSRAECILKQKLPSIYIQIKNDAIVGTEDARNYDEIVYLMFENSFLRRNESLIDKTMQSLVVSLKADQCYSSKVRVRLLNQFESILREYFMYLGMLHDQTPNLKKMKGSWIKQ